MNTKRLFNKAPLIAALGLALQAADGYGWDYQAQTGALSYTFFNLSPNQWTLTPYVGGGNPYGTSGSNSLTQGWGNDMNFNSPGFFNQTAFGGKKCGSAPAYVSGNYDFYYTGDPISAPANLAFGSSTTLLQNGSSGSYVEYTTAFSSPMNPPALGDSWLLSIGAPGTKPTTTMVMANMASAGNMLNSGNGATDYPYCSALTGLWYNANINPPEAQNATFQTYQPAGSTAAYWQWMNNGEGFVPAGNTMNLNTNVAAANYAPMGGLWMGLNNPNSSNYAANSLNLAMYPLNLSAYVGQNNGNVINGLQQTYSSIYGGHYTLAIGDPYLVSSYAAKILWYIVTSTTPNGYALSQSSLSTKDISNLINVVAPSGGTGVFQSSSISANYASWLLNSPSLAVPVMQTMNTAASKPITHESIWGELSNAMLSIATKVAIDSLSLLAGPEAGVGVELAVSYGKATFDEATGLIGPTVSDAITAAFTTTVSPPPPQAANAPAMVNSTYSSSNLLGMLLANSFLQAEIYNALGMGTQSSYALWSNDSINVDNLCNTTSVSISNNLISGPCYTTGSNGSLTSTTVATGSQTASVQAYENVLSLYPNSQSNTAINLWSAILTGSDITTVQSSGATNNGYMQVANPSISAFSPPTQLVDNTGTNPPITVINTAFSANTGILSVASYTIGYAVGTYPIPPGVPNLNLVVAGPTMSGQGIQFTAPTYYSGSTTSYGYYTYNTSTGILTLQGYSGSYWNGSTGSWGQYGFPNGQYLSINMSTCPVGSNVTLSLTPNPTSPTALGAVGALSCNPTYPITAANSPIPATTPTLSTVNTSMPQTSSGLVPAFYPPGSRLLSSAQNQLLSGYSSTGSLVATQTVSPTDGTSYSLVPASSNVTAVTSSTSTTTNGITTTTTTVNGVSGTPQMTLNSPIPNGTTSTSITVPPGYLMVTGYGYYTPNGSQIAQFANGVQTLDMTTCATNAATLSAFPYSATAGSTTGSEAFGYLTCQSPPTLPYNACTNDPQATGGVIAAITTAPAADGTGAQFELGCACIPNALGGPASGTSLGGVIVGATSLNPTASCN